eukprot:g70257.t1
MAFAEDSDSVSENVREYMQVKSELQLTFVPQSNRSVQDDLQRESIRMKGRQQLRPYASMSTFDYHALEEAEGGQQRLAGLKRTLVLAAGLASLCLSGLLSASSPPLPFAPLSAHSLICSPRTSRLKPRAPS